MYDMHYDLLTILYFNMIENNQFSNKEKMIKDLKQRYQNNNVLGGIINLYFMTAEEMKEELDISQEQMIDMKKMLEKSIQFLEKTKKEGVIPKKVNFAYSIEGCDYIQSPQHLVELYQLGIRSILPVWNHKNQYGSGNRTESGLTENGRDLVKKAIELGMILDLSHANEATFSDIMEVYKKERQPQSIIMCSHSNVRTLCDRVRNVTDEQLRQLKEMDGYIGLFTNGNFLARNNEEIPYQSRQQNFIRHLDYLINKIGYSTDKIVLSTDDMNFHPDESYHHLEAFPIENIGTEIYNCIAKNYGKATALKIIKENAENIIHQVNNPKEKTYHK